MKANLLLFSACFSLTFTAYAAFTSCKPTTTLHEQQQGLYQCTKLGWTGPNPPTYFSNKDESTGPGKHFNSQQPVMTTAEVPPAAISCQYNNLNFIIGADNGIPAGTYVYDTPRAYRNSAIQICQRSVNESRYVIIAEMGSVYGNGVINTILNPPQEILSVSTLPTGEVKLDLNTARLDIEKPKADSFLIVSADGGKAKLFDVNPNVNKGEPTQSGSFHFNTDDYCVAQCGRRCQDAPAFCGQW